jgi:secreted trypsin-like serine protease
LNCPFYLFADPLVSNRDGRYLLLGKASFGLSCDFITEYHDEDSGGPSSPRSGVYTNVASYVDWIKANTDYNECQISKCNYFNFWLGNFK